MGDLLSQRGSTDGQADYRQDFFRLYPNEYFVETGSLVGRGIERAINAGFRKIISIELADHYFELCRDRFSNCPHVTIVKGDSALVLAEVIREISVPITFWLDGHHSCGDTALGLYWAPLMQELDQISRHPIKTHTLVIDDMRCWEIPNKTHGFYKPELLEKIKSINPAYQLRYHDGVEPNDILAAYPPSPQGEG